MIYRTRGKTRIAMFGNSDEVEEKGRAMVDIEKEWKAIYPYELK